MNLANPAASPWQFANAEHALFWSADVLRQRRLPRLTPLWRDLPPDAANLHAAAAEVSATTPWGAELTLYLPSDPDERFSLALAVEQALASLGQQPGEPGHILRLHAWGDWESDARLRGALIMQERARRESQRLRLNYRYSFRQLGLQLAIDPKTAAKRVREALALLSDALTTTNLIFLPTDNPRAPQRFTP